jgi:hypothetical protein
MTKIAAELVSLSKRLHFWQLYDSSVKAELFSTAIAIPSGVLIVDPVPLREELLQERICQRAVVGIFVTNANHCRAALDFSKKFAAPVFAHSATCASCEFPSTQAVQDGQTFADNVRAVEIAGAAPGEMAIHCEEEEGTVIIGDALINFEPYGFSFLPPKYCSNAKEMRRSLRHLLDFNFERMLFAHGTPLMHAARKELEGLLQNTD